MNDRNHINALQEIDESWEIADEYTAPKRKNSGRRSSSGRGASMALGVVTVVLIAAVITFSVGLFSHIRKTAMYAGESVGKAFGSTVGTAIGSFEGIESGISEGVSEGKTAGLSAEDTKTRLAGIMLNDLGDHGKLEVLTAKVRIKNFHEVGEKYTELYTVMANAVFTVDLNKAEVRSADGSVTVILPAPEAELYVDESQRETLMKWESKLFNGTDKDGIEAYINSEEKITSITKEQLDAALYKLASEEAERQVKELAENVCLENVKISVETRES